MPLPVISTPTYELTIPSIKKTIEFRPFLVKEEKILLLAMESEDSKQIARAVKQVLTNCIVTKGIDVSQLATFDIELLFLNIRGKSVGEKIPIVVTCEDDGETEVEVEVDVDDIKVINDKDHVNTIDIGGGYMIKMKYPKFDEFIENNFVGGGDESFKLIARCVDAIYNDEESWDSADFTEKEMIEFLEQFPTSNFKKIEQFFETMPKLSHEITVTNPKTKKKNKVVLEGLASFFS
jgi:hypothetical protein